MAFALSLLLFTRDVALHIISSAQRPYFGTSGAYRKRTG